MDMKVEADRIYHLPVSNQVKLVMLQDLELDCLNEMEAEDQNMRPEVRHNLSEGYRLAQVYIRELKKSAQKH